MAWNKMIMFYSLFVKHTQSQLKIDVCVHACHLVLIIMRPHWFYNNNNDFKKKRRKENNILSRPKAF